MLTINEGNRTNAVPLSSKLDGDRTGEVGRCRCTCVHADNGCEIHSSETCHYTHAVTHSKLSPTQSPSALYGRFARALAAEVEAGSQRDKQRVAPPPSQTPHSIRVRLRTPRQTASVSEITYGRLSDRLALSSTRHVQSSRLTGITHRTCGPSPHRLSPFRARHIIFSGPTILVHWKIYPCGVLLARRNPIQRR